MLKDFATRSLWIADDNTIADDIAGRDSVSQYQFKKEREWDERYIEYFYNS